jgi:uncharacterized RDD family membrane protein YckC
MDSEMNSVVNMMIKKGGGLLAQAKADLGKRFIAAVIDSVIAGVVSTIISSLGIGSLIGGAYILAKDAIMFEILKDPAWKNRSIGKKVMRLEVVGPGGSDVDIALSAKRNWPLAIGQLASFIIALLGVGGVARSNWSTLIGLTGIIGLIEIVLVFTDPQGKRLGDRLADTVVREVAEEAPSLG